MNVARDECRAGLAVAGWPSCRPTLGAGIVAAGWLLLALPVSAQDPAAAELAGESRPLVEPPADAVGDQAVTASELQSAIDAIKRRVAEQQEARETTGASALTAELRSARAAITELTQNLMRLRGERDALQADLDARRASESALSADLADASERTAELEAALADARERAVLAEQRASETAAMSAAAAERAKSDLAERDATIAESRAESEALLEQQRALEADLAQAEDRAAALADELAAERAAKDAAEEALAEASAARDAADAELATARAEVSAMAERLADGEALRRDIEAELAALQLTSNRLEEALAAAEREQAGLTEALAESEAAEAATRDQLATAEEARAALAARVDELVAEQAAALAAAEALEAERNAEFADLREVATRSVTEVEALGETLLATLAENEELTLALSEVRTTRAALEAELAAMRRDLEARDTAVEGPPADESTTMPLALVASDAVVEEMDAEIADLRRQVATLTEDLIARDKQLAAVDAGDSDAPSQPLGLLQSERDSRDAGKDAIAGDLATVRAGAEREAPGLITASLEPDAAVERFLGQVDAVDTGDGWWMTVPEGLVFAPGSNELAPGTEGEVAQVAALIGYFGDAAVRILGHTDSFGDAAVNKRLSLERAETVAQLLIDRFEIDPARIATEGLGEEQPVASNATIEGRRANRRVEVYVQRQ